MNPIMQLLGRRLRLAVVGGGPGSFIGPVHRTAALLDGRFELVAGVLSSNPERSRQGRGRSWARRRARLCRLARIARCRAGAHRRCRRDRGHDTQRQPPRDLRHGARAGFDVICDKPLTTSLADALDLVRRVRASGRVFCVTHNYTAYPMVRHARDMVRAGAIGEVRQIQLAYVQGHNATLVEGGSEAPSWRFDPGPPARLWSWATSARTPTTSAPSSRARS